MIMLVPPKQQEVNRRKEQSQNKGGLEVIREEATINEIAAKYGVHLVMSKHWKEEVLE